MEKVNLPTEDAHEPMEEAKQPTKPKTMSSKVKGPKNNHNVSFTEAADSTDKPISQSSSYKDALSQPAPGLTQRQRLQWLQKRRTPGLWVQCDDCDRWRHLAFVIDSHELPNKWYCKMNPDSSQASCSAPEMPIRLREEEDLIHSSFSAGSVVWARLPGWPWWPAMVDDCPDTEQFYWLDGFSDIPTHYNVVFFDTLDVTRAWIAPDQIKPFSANKKSFKHLLKEKKFKSRLEVAMRQAEDADLLPLADRLGKYSFIARYKGNINKPKTNKKIVEKFKKQIKRKLDIEFSDESSDDSDDFIEPKEPSNKKANKNGNVIILGTPKRNKRNIIVPKVLNDVYTTKEQSNEEQNLTENATIELLDTREIGGDTSVVNEQQNKINIEPDSMTVQIGSSEIAHDVKENAGKVTTPTLTSQKETVDSQESQETLQQSYKARTASPGSDDFDF